MDFLSWSVVISREFEALVHAAWTTTLQPLRYTLSRQRVHWMGRLVRYPLIKPAVAYERTKSLQYCMKVFWVKLNIKGIGSQEKRRQCFRSLQSNFFYTPLIKVKTVAKLFAEIEMEFWMEIERGFLNVLMTGKCNPVSQSRLPISL